MASASDTTRLPASGGPVTHAIAAMQASAAASPYRPEPYSIPIYAEPEPQTDADLLDLGRRWERAEADYTAAADRAADLKGVGCPPPPEAIFVREGDAGLGLATYACQRGDGRFWYWLGRADYRASQGLRRRQTKRFERPVRPSDSLPKGALTTEDVVPWPEAQARADEIVQAFDAWRSAMAKAQDESGYREADALCCRHAVAVRELEDAIEAATARTIAGLRIKAKLIRHIDEAGNVVPEALTTGPIDDILALAA